MKQEKSQLLGTLKTDLCGKCNVEVKATVWPYLKGTGRNGEALVWYRCPSCQRLFSTLAQRETTLEGSEISGGSSWPTSLKQPAKPSSPP